MRIAFDVSEQTKREIKIRLAREERTLSEVMRAFCTQYKDFGLYPGQQVDWEKRTSLPDLPGIYFVYAQGELRYIGRSVSLYRRLAGNHHRSKQFARLKASIFWIEAPIDILVGLEDWLIDTLEPSLNGAKIPDQDQITQTFAIWKTTRKKLRMIYAITGEKMISILDRLVTAELERVTAETSSTSTPSVCGSPESRA